MTHDIDAPEPTRPDSSPDTPIDATDDQRKQAVDPMHRHSRHIATDPAATDAAQSQQQQ